MESPRMLLCAGGALLLLVTGSGVLASCSDQAPEENVLSDNLYERQYGPLPFDLGGVRVLDAQDSDWPNDASMPVWTCWGTTLGEAKARLNATLLTGTAADSNCDFNAVDPEDYVELSP